MVSVATTLAAAQTLSQPRGCSPVTLTIRPSRWLELTCGAVSRSVTARMSMAGSDSSAVTPRCSVVRPTRTICSGRTVAR